MTISAELSSAVCDSLRHIVAGLGKGEARRAAKTRRALVRLIDSSNVSDEDKHLAMTYCMAIDAWSSYSLTWSRLLQYDFDESWRALQDAIDSAWAFERYTNAKNDFHIGYLASLCRELEKIYRHKYFCSSEYLIRESECTICGHDPFDVRCHHVRGDVYGGRIASVLVTKADIISVSITENPRDKRCVMIGKGNHHMARMFVDLFREKRWSALRFGGVIQSDRDEKEHIDVVYTKENHFLFSI